MQTFWQYNILKIKRFFQTRFSAVAEINKRYATPRIKITPVVRFALLSLRVYLFILVLILIYKFITLLK